MCRRASGQLRSACIAVLVLSALTLSCWFAWSHYRTSRLRGLMLRIGADDAPPYYEFGKDGTVTGLIPDILNEAARHLGIVLIWIPIRDKTPEEAVGSIVDLWPALHESPQRLARFHMTKPWLDSGFFLLTREQDPWKSPADLAGRRVAFLDTVFSRVRVKELYPGSIDLPEPSKIQAVVAVCRQQAAAAFIDRRVGEYLLLHRPHGCESTDFHIRYEKSIAPEMSVMSPKELGPVADMLRDEAVRTASSEVLARELDKWDPLSAAESQSLLALRRFEEDRREMLLGLLAIGIWLALLLRQNLRIKKTSRLIAEA